MPTKPGSTSLASASTTAFFDSSSAIILAAATARTDSIRLTSDVTVLSAANLIRVFQAFARTDLISKGRAAVAS
ncbi:hypothetical protein [Paraburkholderia sp. MM5477-R1]|uniref:hypothetical protein n=1 Tax=Paraburkholderia sp. MM5477-R1 TaxID=2991062 RepID=UPI003D2612C9